MKQKDCDNLNAAHLIIVSYLLTISSLSIYSTILVSSNWVVSSFANSRVYLAMRLWYDEIC